MSKILTIYYSRKGENYWNGSIRDLEKGNTEIVAEMIQKAVGGELFEVDTIKKYSDSYHTCAEEAKRELEAKERVAVKQYLDNLNDYEIIFVGYPNWWGTMPMVLFTFLEKYDLAGKKIIPFCTNEGSGMGTSEEDLAEICTGASILPGLAIRGSDAAQSEGIVADWAKKMV